MKKSRFSEPMICSSLNRFFTSNLLAGLDSKPPRYSKAGGTSN
jgi:hypothetical protein